MVVFPDSCKNIEKVGKNTQNVKDDFKFIGENICEDTISKYSKTE